MTTPSPIIGIDLGTTNSLVSVLQAGVPVVLPNVLGEILTPSAVSVDADGRVLVGAAARARATTDPLNTALSFKRDMGTDRVYHLRNRPFQAPDLSALVLAALKADAEAALGVPVEEAVVTVPAYFDDLQRQATRDAGVIAGLRVDRIINEPTAAALAYGLHQRDRELRAVVLDLGGGTFDVTVLEIMEGVVEIQSSAGDTRLGGDDFVDALVQPVAELAGAWCGELLEASPVAGARVREACLAALHRLSGMTETRVLAPGLSADGASSFDLDVRLDRDQAESYWQDLLQRMKGITVRALRDAGIGPDGVDQVLLVGGATRMPCVARFVANLFGRLPLRTLQPDEAVVQGAAVQAALKAGDAAVDDMVVTDVAPFTLGVETMNTAGGRMLGGVFTPIIERGTVIPVSRVLPLFTVGHRQTQVRIAVYQGEHFQAEENRKLGEYLIKGIPPAPAGEETLDVRFSYDINGVLEVETTVVSTGRKTELVLQSGQGRLTPVEVAASRARLGTLKVDLRELLPNRVALERADALHVELTGPEREQLSEAMASLRSALLGQDADEVAQAREQLVALVAFLGSRPVPP